jgi:hypothetical protein
MTVAGYFDRKWFVQQFQGHFMFLQKCSITFREMFAIITALATWASSMRRKKILWQCDDMAIVYISQSCTSNDWSIMNLDGSVLFIQFDLELSAVHIISEHNDVAECLSRLQMDRFSALSSGADIIPTKPFQIDWKFY